MEGGPPIFGQDFSCPALLTDRQPGFPYGALTRSGAPFQTLPVPKPAATGLVRVRSPLLTESRLMSFPPATEMFQFAGFASPPYRFRRRSPLARGGCPIRKSADRRARASPRSFSQRATSFLASQCQGIHQMPLSWLPSRSRRPRRQTPGSGLNSRKDTAACPQRHAGGHVTPLHLSNTSPAPAGGGDRARTGALLRAKQALSQLSYTPAPEAPTPRPGGPGRI